MLPQFNVKWISDLFFFFVLKIPESVKVFFFRLYLLKLKSRISHLKEKITPLTHRFIDAFLAASSALRLFVCNNMAHPALGFSPILPSQILLSSIKLDWGAFVSGYLPVIPQIIKFWAFDWGLPKTST